jgi:hypothetical protein
MLARTHIVERSGTLFAFLGTSSFRWHGWLRKKAGRSASGGCSGFGRNLGHRHDLVFDTDEGAMPNVWPPITAIDVPEQGHDSEFKNTASK